MMKSPPIPLGLRLLDVLNIWHAKYSTIDLPFMSDIFGRRRRCLFDLQYNCERQDAISTSPSVPSGRHIAITTMKSVKEHRSRKYPATTEITKIDCVIKDTR